MPLCLGDDLAIHDPERVEIESEYFCIFLCISDKGKIV